jgi:hypothetical protein
MNEIQKEYINRLPKGKVRKWAGIVADGKMTAWPSNLTQSEANAIWRALLELAQFDGVEKN